MEGTLQGQEMNRTHMASMTAYKTQEHTLDSKVCSCDSDAPMLAMQGLFCCSLNFGEVRTEQTIDCKHESTCNTTTDYC